MQDIHLCYEVSFEKSYVALMGLADPDQIEVSMTSAYSKYSTPHNTQAKMCYNAHSWILG